MKKIPSLKLNSGHSIPVLGLGTWQSEPGLANQAVKFALSEAGYTHIDCAKIYGNEPEIGQAFDDVFSAGKIKRADIFITSKLWNTAHNPKSVETACKQTLTDLQLEYLDLYLMHWGLAFAPNATWGNGPIPLEKVSIQQTWQAMEKLVDQGLVKSIGVSNFNAPMLADLLTYAKIRPAVNQIELHPYHAQTELVEFCQSLGMVVTAYSPLGAPGGAGKNAIKIIEDPVITQLAEKYHQTPAQILIRWAIDRQTVAIPKSTTPARITENFQVFDFKLSSHEIEEITALNRNLRHVNPADWGIPYFS